jgi:Zn-dependent M28 family amino/carboxypeptidase
MSKLLTILLLASLCISCSNSSNTDELKEPVIDADKIAEHIKVLASDEFGGRMPFTKYETKTIEYLKSQFEAMGVQPGNGDSFYQKVPLVEIEAFDISPLKINGNGIEMEYQYKTDFVALSRRVSENIDVNNSEIVFAGYGVIAPEYGWNDYKDIDVKGKTVLVLVNDPGFGTNDSTFFKGNAMTYYGRWTYKYEEAARQGATGIMIVHQTEPASYPWGVVENSWSGPNLYLKSENNNMSRCAFEGWVSLKTAKELFTASGREEYDFTSEAKKREFKPFNMELSVSVSFNNKTNFSESNNVAGLIKGSESPDELIIYTAHWDHLGIGSAINGDSIFNGAIDNASGTATLLEIARAFTKHEQPKRSILFLAVTAEEQGLLGSAYYASNPIYPPKKTVAVINMDALMAIGEMKDLTVVGYGQSELDDLAKNIATKQGRYIIPDPKPGSGHFFRSDHFSFAKVGIPALYASGRYEHMTKGVEYVKKKSEKYVSTNYHQPSDEYVEDWDLSGMVLDGTLFFELGGELSTANIWPKWKQGSEFKSIREGE